MQIANEQVLLYLSGGQEGDESEYEKFEELPNHIGTVALGRGLIGLFHGAT